ncbi:CrcB family protein [Cellulomonas sp. S1-8]|uniref:FluC/FEX family fluoride channel n=1 Tax=Cellulomonas sp. S1-8 TaxID=2904790 RepID=UPI002AD57EBA|nr:CrcB family protein [Cellulomonas sp. S1-8]
MAGLTPPAARHVPTALPLPAAALLVGAGGSVGVLVRALLEQAWPPVPGAWPWTTFWINVTGSFLLGALLGTLQRGPDVGRRRAVRLGLGTGVIGGYTTYSTFVLEVEGLLTGGHVVAGIAYALVSVVLGVAAAVAGTVVAGRVAERLRPTADDEPAGGGVRDGARDEAGDVTGGVTGDVTGGAAGGGAGDPDAVGEAP